ncbi:MAG: autotransporter-associated beta strand repeat-containing protein [Verrucomicrobiota bacterium]
MSARLERKQGLIQLERSGPAIAPITFPGPGDIIVTQALQIELAQSGLTGFSFLPVIKHTVVELDWEGWDVTADTPEEWPDGGEPEGYVVGQPHSTAAASPALVLTSGGSITVSGGVSGTIIINAPLQLEGSYNITQKGLSTMTLGGDISSGVASSIVFTLSGSNATNNTVTGNISNGVNGATLGLTKSANAKWIVSGDNTYTGATLVNQGTLQAGSTTAFGTDSAVDLSPATTTNVSALSLAGFNNTIGSLASTLDGTYGGSLALGGATLTIDGTNASPVTYNGVIGNAVSSLTVTSGAGNIVKNGSGTQIFAGSNVLTGSTTVNGGKLLVATNSSTISGTGSGSLSVAAGANLRRVGGQPQQPLRFHRRQRFQRRAAGGQRHRRDELPDASRHHLRGHPEYAHGHHADLQSRYGELQRQQAAARRLHRRLLGRDARAQFTGHQHHCRQFAVHFDRGQQRQPVHRHHRRRAEQ